MNYQAKVEFLQKLKKNRDYYKNLPNRGPHGASVWSLRDHWSRMPTAIWTRAAHQAGFESMPAWGGPFPSAVRFFPKSLVREITDYESGQQKLKFNKGDIYET